MRVIAVQDYYYQGKTYHAGEEFEVDDVADMRSMIDLGRLKRTSESSQQQVQQQQQPAAPAPATAKRARVVQPEVTGSGNVQPMTTAKDHALMPPTAKGRTKPK